MRDLPIPTRHGSTVVLRRSRLEALEADLSGTLLTEESPGYEEARSVWNAMIDRRPALILRCAASDDVVHAVRLAREHELLMSVRGGGHNIAGTGVCDGGLVIDLSALRAVRVDAHERTARVSPGCTLGDFDREAQAFGLATPVGINSTTGIAGLTLGGGFGWLSRKHGMTVDNLLAADIVTADGERLRASDLENQELFWGIRGGGGNFGVVTSFDFRLHPVGPEVLAGLIVHPLEDAPDVLRYYADFTAQAPDELAVWVVLRKAPPLPFLPPEWHGREVLVLAVCHAGDVTRGERILEPLRRFGHPIADVIGPKPYSAWQQAFDPLLTPGARNYWKSHDFVELGEGVLHTVMDYARSLPTPETEIFIAHMGGAIARVPSDATAYPHRSTRYVLNVHGRWADPGMDEECVAWSRKFFDDAARHASGGVYVNFMTEDETARLGAAYGENYPRLAALKRRYDPDNVFRTNQNILPAPLSEPMPEI